MDSTTGRLFGGGCIGGGGGVGVVGVGPPHAPIRNATEPANTTQVRIRRTPALSLP